MADGEKFNIPRLGLSGEIERTQEQEPQKYFKVKNVESGLFGYGHIPPEAIEALVGERFRVTGIDTDEGQPSVVRIEAEDISQALGMDGSNPQHWPANWWAGYASAFKNARGELGGDRGQVAIPVSNGVIQEGEEDPEIFQPE